MKLWGALICILVVVLDVTAGILGLEAELTQDRVKHIRYLVFECIEPSYGAFRLGIAAAATLLVAHIIANVSGGCICFATSQGFEQSTLHKHIAAASLLLSWILLAGGLGLLIVGAISNSKSKEFCSLTHHNFLAIGGVVCFLHGASCSAYYVTATTSNTEKNNDIEGINMENR